MESTASPDGRLVSGRALVEDTLEHYGTKGMKWGVRRAAVKVATSRTNAAIKVHENARDNKGVTGKVALLDKYTWGRNGRHEAYQNKRISELERSKERIEKGELVVTTLIFGPQYSRK
jgi:hypothetical protein